jgi:hypothetical protein
MLHSSTPRAATFCTCYRWCSQLQLVTGTWMAVTNSVKHRIVWDDSSCSAGLIISYFKEPLRNIYRLIEADESLSQPLKPGQSQATSLGSIFKIIPPIPAIPHKQFHPVKFLISSMRVTTAASSYIWRELTTIHDRLCGLVVRVLGCRSGGPGSIPGTTRKKCSWSGTGSTQPREYNWGTTW